MRKITAFELKDCDGCLGSDNARATIAFLRELPHLRQLFMELTDLPLVDCIVTSLVFSPTKDDNIAPQLRALAMRKLPTLFDGGSLVTVVASRRGINTRSTSKEYRSCSCLEEVQLGRPLSVSDSALASQWESLCNNGLKVTYE
ncbi:uncharacterized protein BT62DRAFT_738937 [Guyanagaster necrorhizus]|uniref:Uncharacterized protein n=1 Tax=Guyanagaster necrorhizus TaxID=856835 RepID=A0A9P8AL60_9AGAR|nr:uncharacterized protein BT62DRAFT_738937 [Guyanagaster necrorhizus MCA 3950]KAG7439384.1 hypothetical protein BT62DRAFT_738937 [Guyanagaster necrorhizus MCA 3950]